MKMVPLGEILLEYKRHPESNNDLPVLTLTEKNGFIRQSERFNKRLATDDTSKYKVVGRFDLAFNPYLLWAGALAQNTSHSEGVISPLYPTFKVDDRYDPSYMYRLLLTPEMNQRYDSIAYGSVPRRRRTSVRDFLALEVPAPPPLDEQRRIAAILDKADAIRQKRRQAIAHLDTLTQSIFDEMFLTGQSWKTSTLDTMADIASGITKGRKTNGTALMQTPYLAVANVQDGYLDLTNVKQIDATAAEIERYKLLPGDLVLTEGGDPDKLGRGSVWDGEIESCIHQNHIFRVRLQPTSLFSPSFLSRYLSTTEAKKYFLKSAKQTTGIASINKTQLSKFPVPLVPIAEQTKFAHYQAILSRKIVASIEALSTADALFASLQSRAFQGEL